MTRTESPWRRHRIAELGLTFDVNRDWTLDTMALVDGVVVSQRSPADAVVFVRYGPGQTLERFLADLGDRLTAATTIADEPTQIAGFPARRVTVSLRRRPVPGPSSHGPTRLRVTAFTARGVPVMIGYRVPEDHLQAIGPELERIVDSLEAAGDADTNATSAALR